MAAPPVLRDLWRLARPRQWYKNLIVLVPLVFSGEADDPRAAAAGLVAFAAFCLLASGSYAVNDAVDAAADRHHPRKRDRPVAAGRIPRAAAVAAGVAWAGAGLAVLASLNPTTVALGGAYLALQAAYNAWLKHALLWDALAVALGFVARALAGTAAIDVGDPTEWLIAVTFLLALYLALAKRRHEVLLLSGEGGVAVGAAHRPVLGRYTVAFLDQALLVAATLTLAAYALYTFFGTTSWMMTTIPFALYGVLRHLYLVHHEGIGDEVEMVFRDRPTVANAAAWLLTSLAVIEGWPQAAFRWVEGLGP